MLEAWDKAFLGKKWIPRNIFKVGLWFFFFLLFQNFRLKELFCCIYLQTYVKPQCYVKAPLRSAKTLKDCVAMAMLMIFLLLRYKWISYMCCVWKIRLYWYANETVGLVYKLLTGNEVAENRGRDREDKPGTLVLEAEGDRVVLNTKNK